MRSIASHATATIKAITAATTAATTPTAAALSALVLSLSLSLSLVAERTALAGPPTPTTPETVAILVLSGDETGVPISEIYSAARRALELNTAYVVAPLDVIGIAEREDAIRVCAGRAACFAEKVRANSSGVDVLLTTSVDALDTGLLLGVRLVDVREGKELGATGDEIPAGMSLLGAMERQLATVVPPSVWGNIAQIEIETIPPNVEVIVGARACASPCELTRMIPGTYPVTLRKGGYITWTGELTLERKKTEHLSRTLVEPETSILESPVLWAGVGVVVVATAVTSFFLLRSNSQTVSLCIARDASLCSAQASGLSVAPR
ncbi:MAG: PEGA domain-containing protein [Deltaproteobacteria bacterium]|nr:PEGA domain-containing protein [Deltaproteobacteria bacterium]